MYLVSEFIAVFKLLSIVIILYKLKKVVFVIYILLREEGSFYKILLIQVRLGHCVFALHNLSFLSWKTLIFWCSTKGGLNFMVPLVFTSLECHFKNGKNYPVKICHFNLPNWSTKHIILKTLFQWKQTAETAILGIPPQIFLIYLGIMKNFCFSP